MKANTVISTLTVALSSWVLFTVSLNAWVGLGKTNGGKKLRQRHILVPQEQWRHQQNNYQAKLLNRKEHKGPHIATAVQKQTGNVGQANDETHPSQTAAKAHFKLRQDKTLRRNDEKLDQKRRQRHSAWTNFVEPETFNYRLDLTRRRTRKGDKPGSLVNDTRRALVHLHVAKSGGTSLDRIGRALAGDSGRRYVGLKHFDWSFIDKLSNTTEVDVIMFLRHPVARAESHFYFIKRQKWTRNLAMQTQSIEEYLHDPESMLHSRDVWQDQQASIMWLTGNHIANWVVQGLSPGDIEERERRGLDYVKMCHLAAQRLNQTLWFGILEDRERSMELLQHALQLDYRPRLPKSNVGGGNKPRLGLSEWSKETLASLMPQDIWLYDYATRLFEARWVQYKTGVFVEPELPPLPELPCTSTRFELNCTSGPLAASGPLYFNHTF